MTDLILVLNTGSSSVKFSLADVHGSQRASGELEKIDSAPRLHIKDADGTVLAEEHWQHDDAPDIKELVSRLLDLIGQHLPDDTLWAAGHRVVHGGHTFAEPVRITDAILDQLDALAPLAPLHLPLNLAPIRVLHRLRPDLPQVACFDTEFHRTLPAVAARFGLPHAYEARGIRRYGFHGLSYEYIAGVLRETAPRLARGRVIVAHLGNGASLCALRDGASIDTTMGFTPLDGLLMGTRPGSLDPGVLLYLLREDKIAPDALEDLLYHHSGLLGVSGIASDMRELVTSDDDRARDALDLFVYRVAREAGGLAASLGGLDAIVFTGGIGEHMASIRAAVCIRLAWLGLDFDAAANSGNARIVSAAKSRVEVRVIPTDEDAMIARKTLAVVHASVV